VLLTAGATAALNLNPTSGPMVSLPLAVFTFVKSPEPAMIARGFGAASVLMLLVLLLFAIARIIGGRGAGQLTKRQIKRAARASLRDQRHFQADAAATAAARTAVTAPAAPAAAPASSATGETL